MNDNTLRKIEAVANSLSFAAGKAREEDEDVEKDAYQAVMIDLFDKLESLMLEE